MDDEPTLEQRYETLAARVAQLEVQLEGLQDALYRRAVLEDETIDELRRRTEPHELARALSKDARERGL
jgi:cell division protein FtsB